jgi:gliding motility-associated-like protein
MRFRLLIIVLTIFISGNLWATHNRFGDITYEYAGTTNAPQRYKVTIRTCTKSSSPADRPFLEMQWGDGTIDSLPRDQIIIMGVDVQQNIYVGFHNYPGPGSYEMTVFDANRNQGIINIPGSVNEPLCIQTKLVISPFLTPNNSVVLEECPCPEFACVGVEYCYSPSAHDIDGDSLSYELIACKGDECDPIGGYEFPNAFGGVLNLDQITGTLCWDSPVISGEYNIAIKIHEWREMPSGSFVEMGWVIRDMQITVIGDCNNDPPVIAEINDTCIIAGASISFQVNATDINGDNITITEFGQPFSETSSPADFIQTNSSSNAQGTFSWSTNCSHISSFSYPVYFVAEDDATPASLTDIKTVFIRVLPPPIQNVDVSPLGNIMNVTWSPTSCSNAVGYKIYRKVGNGPPPSTGCCDSDAAEQAGFILVGDNTNINDTTFSDNGGLTLGNTYCYVVVVYFEDGATSCPSEEDCEQLKMDVPIIINVSVGNTDLVAGIDTVRWVHPAELDTVVNFPGDYYYEVYVSQGFTSANTLIFTSAPTTFLFQQPEELIVDNSFFNPLNTDNLPYTYKVVLYNTTSTIGQTNTASSIFLSLIPNDNQIGLSWQENVPWNNTLYEVFRESSPGSGIWNLIGNSTTPNYLDTGLINGATYCYRVRSEGNYSTPFIPQTLYNWSQEECSSPIDQTAPCPPQLTIDANCDIPENSVVWNNPNNTCADDVMQYNVYYTPIEGEPFELIMTFNSQFDTSFIHVNEGSIAGCYYITAVDSVQYGNESLPSNIVCTDNCPSYWLPNIFTPNGDGINDLFIPFPYQFVESVEMRIYNRWGQLVFETTNPDITWNGTNMENGEVLSEGVYYYTCLVNTIRLIGTDPVELNGFVHLMIGNSPNE